MAAIVTLIEQSLDETIVKIFDGVAPAFLCGESVIHGGGLPVSGISEGDMRQGPKLFGS